MGLRKEKGWRKEQPVLVTFIYSLDCHIRPKPYFGVNATLSHKQLYLYTVFRQSITLGFGVFRIQL